MICSTVIHFTFRRSIYAAAYFMYLPLMAFSALSSSASSIKNKQLIKICMYWPTSCRCHRRIMLFVFQKLAVTVFSIRLVLAFIFLVCNIFSVHWTLKKKFSLRVIYSKKLIFEVRRVLYVISNRVSSWIIRHSFPLHYFTSEYEQSLQNYRHFKSSSIIFRNS